METISNVANSASKMIWGDGATQSGTEPKSGETGQGTATQPYDSGNKDPESTSRVHETAAAPSGSSAPPNTAGAPESTQFDTSSKAGGFGASEPSVGADPASAQKPFQKQQGGDRPNEAPNAEEDEAVKEKKDKGEELVKQRDPNDHSGEPLKMHDGSERNDNETKEEAGQEGGGEHGKEKGSGEQWVKTSGLAADGGDFDATKPGAGREADRLMDQKGIERTQPGEPAPKEPSPAGTKEKEKQSIGSKIKDKLHIGKH